MAQSKALDGGDIFLEVIFITVLAICTGVSAWHMASALGNFLGFDDIAKAATFLISVGFLAAEVASVGYLSRNGHVKGNKLIFCVGCAVTISIASIATSMLSMNGKAIEQVQSESVDTQERRDDDLMIRFTKDSIAKLRKSMNALPVDKVDERLAYSQLIEVEKANLKEQQRELRRGLDSKTGQMLGSFEDATGFDRSVFGLFIALVITLTSHLMMTLLLDKRQESRISVGATSRPAMGNGPVAKM